MVDVKNLIFFPGVPYFVDGRLVAGRDSLVLMKNRLWSVSGVTALGHDTLSSIIGAETQELHTWSLYFCLPSHTWAHLAWFPVEYFQQLLTNGLPNIYIIWFHVDWIMFILEWSATATVSLKNKSGAKDKHLAPWRKTSFEKYVQN